MKNSEASANNRQNLSDENQAIYGILMNILKSWQPETEIKEVDQEEAETVTLSLKKDTHSVVKELDETVILPRKDLTKGPMPEKKSEKLEKTIILTPDGSSKESVPEKSEKFQDTPSKTVIISPQKANDETLTSTPHIQSKDVGDKNNFECDETEVKKPERLEFLTETVILKPEKVRGEEKDGDTA